MYQRTISLIHLTFGGGACKMDFDPSVSIRLQVAGRIRMDIASGRLAPGEKLPGSRDLAISCSINPNTAARVYQELEKEALCITRRGLGTFVTEDAEKIRSTRNALARDTVRTCIRSLQLLGIPESEAIRMLQTMEAGNNA